MKTTKGLFLSITIALAVVVAAVILLSIQPSANQPPPAPSSGEALYAQYCESCHRALANSQKRGRSAEHIQLAIDIRPQMKHLSNLTPAQIQAIADALAIP